MAPSEISPRIGRYDLLEPLGKGSTGTVYKAQETASGRIVALKVLSDEIARDAEARSRFYREADAVAGLSHPNIVQIVDRGEDGDRAFLVMEYVEGTSLDVVLRRRRLSLQEVVQVVKQVGRALEAAHREGIVHRDLNPRNILVSATLSTVKLAHFGISRFDSVARKLGNLTTKEMSLGTLSYLAPEQAVEGAAVDHRADIYALGVVFYEALTGRIPLGKFSLPAELNRELPSEIDPIVLKCLATDPGKRFPSVGQLIEQVEKLEEMMRFQLLDELQGLKRGTSKLLGSTSPLGSRGVMILFGLLAVALVGAGAWMLLHPAAPPASSAPPAATSAADPAAAPTPTPPAVESAATTPPAPALVVAPTAEVAEKEVAKPKKELAPPPTNAPIAAETKPKPAKPAPDPAIAELEVARGKFDARLFDQALADAQALVATYPSSPVAIEGYFLIARSQVGLQRSKEALGTYVEIQSRFKNDPRAAEAAYQQAKLVQAGDSKKTTEEAKRLYADCAANYPASPWSARALAAKAEIEREQRATLRDPSLGTTVPAALATYRDLTARFAGEPVAEKAFWELGQMYEDLKRWDLATKAYEDLGRHFPKTRFDTWFQAAEIYERRLKDAAKAKSTYALVPTTSPRYKEAQKKIGS
jgi:TolA-binding protein/predicted Ser/Thr protein kinase